MYELDELANCLAIASALPKPDEVSCFFCQVGIMELQRGCGASTVHIPGGEGGWGREGAILDGAARRRCANLVRAALPFAIVPCVSWDSNPVRGRSIPRQAVQSSTEYRIVELVMAGYLTLPTYLTQYLPSPFARRWKHEVPKKGSSDPLCPEFASIASIAVAEISSRLLSFSGSRPPPSHVEPSSRIE
ncbi:hypothetical protein GQ53DRAFT_744445 [Thozetella sp. PMI_491]|nr:hypothetical protein GQ53DRAFT_744445 [Thozetella sp. PMI_491]